MFNPLLPDLSKLKDQELDERIFDLTKKYSIALRLGSGSAAQQIVLNLDAYKMEQQQRQYNANKELENKNKNSGMDDLINVD
jgi:mevalonate pyrophosphate decarboxylase